MMSVVAFSFTSCKDDDDDEMTPTPTYANRMVTLTSPDAPGVDLLADNVKLNTAPLNFTQNTPYIQVASGNRNVKVNVAGTSTVALDLDPIALTAGKIDSVFAKWFPGGVSSQTLGAQTIVNE